MDGGKRLLDILENAGDDHLGQTLVRLARLAEAAHRFDAARDLSQTCDRVHGCSPEVEVPVGRDGAAAARTEVSR